MHAFSKRRLAYQKEVIRQYYGAIGAYIDVTTSGDDFEMQKAQFVSTATFDEMIAAVYERTNLLYPKIHKCLLSAPYLRQRIWLNSLVAGLWY